MRFQYCQDGSKVTPNLGFLLGKWVVIVTAQIQPINQEQDTSFYHPTISSSAFLPPFPLLFPFLFF